MSSDVVNVEETCKSICQQLVVCGHKEGTTFDKVMKVLNGYVNSKQFTIKSTVARLSWFEHFGKISKRTPLVMYMLPQLLQMRQS